MSKIESDGYLWSNEETIQLWAYFYGGNEVPPGVTSATELRKWYFDTFVAPKIRAQIVAESAVDFAEERYRAISFREIWEVINPDR